MRSVLCVPLLLGLAVWAHPHRRSDAWTLLPDRLGDVEAMPIREQDRAKRDRETEGVDDRDVEVFDPNGGDETTWFRPLVPFSFTFGLLAPWWEGPNVCTERNEVEEPEEEEEEEEDFLGFRVNIETTRCVPSDSSYICTKRIQRNGVRKTITLRRQCCHGYIRRTDGRPGCATLKMENVIDTIKVLEMGQFVQWIKDADIREKLMNDNYTVFTPSNEAITDYEDETENNEISAIGPVKRLVDVSSLVKGHIIQGFVNADHLENEQQLESLNGNVKIRINRYHPAHEIITANCVPISGKNNFATNGIVHLTSGVLPQPTKSVGEIIESDDEFATFRRLLRESGLMEELKKEGQSWTLFAPTDDAFQKLPRVLRERIESGETCVQNILYQHVVRGTVCTSAVINRIQIKNILDNVLSVTRDEAEKLRVDGSNIDSENFLGINGIIHKVEKVLVPPQAQSLLEALEEQEREDLLRLIEIANLTSELEEIKNVTFFIPSKEAFQNLPNETLQEMENNPELVKNLLSSHIVVSHLPTKMFAENRHFETLNGYNIHLKLQELFPGIVTGASVQCAHITSHDHQVCGAVIHKINKVLMPPKGSIMDTLGEMEEHDIVFKMLQLTDLKKKLEEEGPFTFLAPSNEAFKRFIDATLKEMLQNKTKAEEILKLHILPETVCCNGISLNSPFQHQFVRTLDGSLLPLHRSLHNRVKFGRARALHCDTRASNGLIHSINRVLLPPPARNVFGMDLWPF